MRLAAALFLVQLIAVAALAQTAEYGRAGGDEIALPFKQSGGLSGSLGFTMSNSGSDFGSKGFAGTVGGALLADRLWFFAAAQRDVNRQFVSTLPQLPAATATADGKLIAQLGSRSTLTAIAGAGRESLVSTTPLTLPSSFLSLHYTGIISSNSFFTAKIDSRRTSSGEPAFFTHW
jgi:hypothetical protein